MNPDVGSIVRIKATPPSGDAVARDHARYQPHATYQVLRYAEPHGYAVVQAVGRPTDTPLYLHPEDLEVVP